MSTKLLFVVPDSPNGRECETTDGRYWIVSTPIAGERKNRTQQAWWKDDAGQDVKLDEYVAFDIGRAINACNVHYAAQQPAAPEVTP